MAKKILLSLAILLGLGYLPVAARADCWWVQTIANRCSAMGSVSGGSFLANASQDSYCTGLRFLADDPRYGVTCCCGSPTVGCCSVTEDGATSYISGSTLAQCWNKRLHGPTKSKFYPDQQAQLNPSDGQMHCVDPNANNDQSGAGSGSGSQAGAGSGSGSQAGAGSGSGAQAKAATPTAPVDPYLNMAKVSLSDLPFFKGQPASLVNQLVGVFMGIIGTIALCMYIYAGILWLASAGNEKSIETSKNVIVWTSIGLVVCFGAYVVTIFILGAVSTF